MGGELLGETLFGSKEEEECLYPNVYNDFFLVISFASR